MTFFDHGIDLGPLTEFGVKRLELAKNLLTVATGLVWDAAEQQMQENYELDAHDILIAYPHLLSLGERRRLASTFPEVTQ